MHHDDTHTAAVGAATQGWMSAFNARDLAKICACYHPDAMLWGTTAQSLITIPAGIRQYFEGHCASATPVSVTLTDQRVRVDGDLAANSGSYTLTVVSAEPPQVLPARFSPTYQQTGDGWLIVDHHSSWVPVQIGRPG